MEYPTKPPCLILQLSHLTSKNRKPSAFRHQGTDDLIGAGWFGPQVVSQLVDGQEQTRSRVSKRWRHCLWAGFRKKIWKNAADLAHI
jgi:hypothetical protein